MARRERNDVDYFPHRVSHGRKMFYLRQRFKNDGYAVWFMLLEELGKADYHYLDLSDPIQVMYLSSAFLVDEQTLIAIIDVLVAFNEFNKDLWEKYDILYNQSFVDSVGDAYKKRGNSCVTLEALFILLKGKGLLNETLRLPNHGKCNLKVPASTQSKVKYSNSKEDVSKDTFVGLPPSTPTDNKSSFSDRCKGFIEKFNELRGTKFQVTSKVEKSLKARLKNYKPQQIISALQIAMKDKNHIENNFKYLTPEFILREDKMEYFLNQSNSVAAPAGDGAPVFINHQNRT